MSLHPQPVCPVPDATAGVARAAFRKGNIYMRMRDEFDALYSDEAFAAVFSMRGQPAEAPWRLALVTIMQYAEGLSDRQAADAVRARIDWKYALSLELTDAGFDSTVLSEFRSRLVTGGMEQQMLDLLLTHFRERKLLKARGRQRTDSTHVLAAIRALNRLECIGETLRHALNSLAVVAPGWLRAHAQPEWVDRYGRRVDDYRLPKGQDERTAMAETIGTDGYGLLAGIYGDHELAWLRAVPAIETLRRVWVQQFYKEGDSVRWRTEQEGIPPSALFIGSPYDPDAHYAKKRTTSWVGYKVHVTETCDEDRPRLITEVETTAGPIADGDVTTPIHQALERKDLLPRVHIVDTGYLDAELVVTSDRDYGVGLLGPARPDSHWQAQQASGFDASHFAIDWDGKKATCPGGHTSESWSPVIDGRNKAVIKIKFAVAHCRACPYRRQCTTAPYARRSLTIRPKEQYLALQQMRARQATAEFKEQYAVRAGVEGTLSQGVRAFDLRRSRYIGATKTHLQHILTAAAIDFVRVGHWLEGTKPAKTRPSSFVALMAPAA